MQTPGVPCH